MAGKKKKSTKVITAADLLVPKKKRRTFEMYAVPEKVTRCPICQKPMIAGKVTSKVLADFFNLKLNEEVFWCQGLRVDKGNRVIPVAEFGLPMSMIKTLVANCEGKRINYREIVNFKYNMKAFTKIDVEDEMYAGNQQALEKLVKLGERFDLPVVSKTFINKSGDTRGLDEMEIDEEDDEYAPTNENIDEVSDDA